MQDSEILDTFFKMIRKNPNHRFIFQNSPSDKMPMTPDQVFRLLMVLRQSELIDSFESDMFQISPSGYLLLDGKLYSEYIKEKDALQKSESNKAEEKENLQMQKLRSDVIDITNKLVDYQQLKNRAKISYILSILAIIIAGLMLMLKWISPSHG